VSESSRLASWEAEILENEPNTAKATAGWGAGEDRAGNDTYWGLGEWSRSISSCGTEVSFLGYNVKRFVWDCLDFLMAGRTRGLLVIEKSDDAEHRSGALDAYKYVRARRTHYSMSIVSRVQALQMREILTWLQL
jgi:hypothetical protein